MRRTEEGGAAMLRKLRLKFVVVCMIMVTLLLAVVVLSIFFSARSNLEHISNSVLNRAMRENPGFRDAPPVPGTVTLPYFTVNLIGTTAYVTGGTYQGLDNTDTLTLLLKDCLSQEKNEGTLPGYSLRYLRRDYGWYTRVAFVDMSMELASLRRMLYSCISIALLALFPLFLISLLISRRAVAPVEAAWQQQRQFLSDASHELKTPLTVILSNAELLERAGLEERPRRWVENIRSESRRMKTLVEEMLTLARADRAEHSSVPEDVSLSDVAADCALSFEPVAFEAGKPIRYEIAQDTVVTGEAEKLRQLITILIDNAVKYGAEGGTIQLLLEKTDRSARLTVSNPGEPLPPEKLSRLFERFYRADTSRGEQFGFGLGLSIADAIAKEHGGELKAESDLVSTRFIYTMPLKR